jgi:hypothetical protein
VATGAASRPAQAAKTNPKQMVAAGIFMIAPLSARWLRVQSPSVELSIERSRCECTEPKTAALRRKSGKNQFADGTVAYLRSDGMQTQRFFFGGNA